MTAWTDWTLDEADRVDGGFLSGFVDEKVIVQYERPFVFVTGNGRYVAYALCWIETETRKYIGMRYVVVRATPAQIADFENDRVTIVQFLAKSEVYLVDAYDNEPPDGGEPVRVYRTHYENIPSRALPRDGVYLSPKKK